ncbi:hypothetical protein HELRODRAFT_110223 [Helobdella robusta]|uniref:Uncharacterized protein n=1 Tax=Helobdella robusta TaxID=6412 RepID=T1EF06_HELRO|nr:hypothetical protein HELRODRAFT_110223 [Helobdella robusta]ESO07930.1 hypothetical protein HELRODRAFT_110223 [Helobdella robusta]
MDECSRIKIVTFQKNYDEALGITLRVNDAGHCIVARIMHGGLIHQQGILHIGDHIMEVNDMNVQGFTVDVLQRMLRDLYGSITLKIVPSYRPPQNQCEIFVKALFNYDPLHDDLIPCPQAGIAFSVGDILQVISKDDHNWWQARHCCQPAGLIPSSELQEWRMTCASIEKNKKFNCSWFGLKRKLNRCSNPSSSSSSRLLDHQEVFTYEEVVRVPSFHRKTLILLGAHGVGRRHIKNTLIHMFPKRFAYPVPHTTRTPKKDEEHGRTYFFITHEQMMADIAAHKYLEYGTHDDNMYGTKLDTIQHIHKQGLVAILDVEPQAMKTLRNVEYSPYIVFVAPPNLSPSFDEENLETMLTESEELESQYGCLFDLKVVNNDIDVTIQIIIDSLDEAETQPQWVPITWVY